jgi:hypothetical protein
MQRARPVPSPSPVGPGRWSFRLYHILQRAGTKGRRYEIRTPAKELVALCRIKKKSDSVSMFADDEEKMEILRFNPKTVRQYAAAFEVVDTLAGRPIGEFRKKVYRPLNKSEWFIFNADGEPVGMVVEAPTPPGLLGRILPIVPFKPKTFELHWGQTVGGRISRKKGLTGMDRMEVDLALDKKESIDRRLALGVSVLLRDDQRNGKEEPAPKPEPTA